MTVWQLLDRTWRLVGTAVVVFIYRAIPSTGEGFSWWLIDGLGFDQHFSIHTNLEEALKSF